ncbi:MAG: glycoside hydrolase family 65 protein [Phenylobacterium sp.]|uniref:HAD-IA family hydrolase n=1 Tax=Phenylobacterium sp. TaxID=1871053 RepID=UPI0025E4447A|nr:HAD-IA family hydrolase [Phenylobacterium sp.]MBA4010631.1 glycoside hydrolase family 65 protein [Phenylobacterium sp.]
MGKTLRAAIFDVDGVLVASPHERAWREALAPFADPAAFTTEFYQANVAGRPRLDGARRALELLAPSAAEARVQAYAAAKQALVARYIDSGEFDAFADAVRFAAALEAAGVRLAIASSSKNAAAMLQQLWLPDGRPVLSMFKADVSGREGLAGKPDPGIFLAAAQALDVPPAECVVVEDAPAGVLAALAGGMAALGVARLGDEALLHAAGAQLVVSSLDQVDVAALAAGALRPCAAAPSRPMEQALDPTTHRGWVLSHRGYQVLTESGVESRFAISNGFLGMRAARSVSRGPIWVSWLGYLRWASWPRCYVAGLFDTPNVEPPVPALVPVADWSRVRLLLNGEVLLGREGEVLRSVRQLDMRRAALLSGWTHRNPAGVTGSGRELRLLSQADRALGLQLLQFAVDQDGVDMQLEASFDLSGLGMEPDRLEPHLGSWRTEGANKGVAMAGAAELRLGEDLLAADQPFPLRWIWRWRSVAGQPVEFARLVSVARGDAPGEDPAPAAEAALARARSAGWRGVLADHERAWEHRWGCADVAIEGDNDVQRVVRFAAYHLLSAANPDDEAVSVGARALTGDGYFGHVFWDTEIYLLPFYTAVWPQAARAMLMYRFRTLPAARDKAAALGYRGALYAWESADTGVETTPERVVAADGGFVDILCGKLEQHISADVAYAVWQYWRATGDDDFLQAAGAEILLETARFWASRATPEADGRRHIRGVIGPDEYHEDIDDNAFTNVMARWNIARGLEVADLLRSRWPAHAERLLGQLALTDAELADWRDAVQRLVTGLDPASGLYEQFAGYHGLEDIDLSAYAGRAAPMDVVLGRERIQRSQVVKQADVVALAALLPEEFPGDAARLNFRHYEPRCGHGSSLSPAMHALVAARVGDPELALKYLHRIAQFDPDPGAAGGVRIAGLGGIWQAVVMGFGGLDLTGDMPALDPQLPPKWRSLSFQLFWRGRTLAVRIAGDQVQATLLAGEPMQVRIAGQVRALAPRPDMARQ